MKSILWFVLIIAVLFSLCLISCVPKNKTPTEIPLQFPVTQLDGVVTFRWEQVDGATSYDIEIGFISPAAYERLYLGINEKVQIGYHFVIQNAGTYRWRVRARNTNGVGPWSDWITFEGVPKSEDGLLTLELTDDLIYECDSIIATVTSYEKTIDKVQLLARKKDETEYTYETVYKDLNEKNQATFTLNKNILENLSVKTKTLSSNNNKQIWMINAQGNGNSNQTDEKEVEIRLISVNPILSVKLSGKEVKDGQYVCLDAEKELPVEAVYNVDIDFLEERIGEKITELGWKYEQAGAPSEMLSVAQHIYSPFDFNSWETKEIAMYMATECTKHATLTVWGTACSDESVTFSEIVTLDFTIDGSLPEASLTFIPDSIWSFIFGGATDTITLSFTATDTKSLCEATLSVFVYKVDENEEQMPGWELVEIPFGLEEFTIGTGENKMYGEVEYSGKLGIPEIEGSASIGGTLTLKSMGVLDFAPVFAMFTTIDCCNVTIGCDTCGDPLERKPVEAELDFGYVIYDNAFFKQDLLNISFIDSTVQGYEGLGDSWLLTSNNPTGTATNVSIDFFVEWTDATITGASETVDATMLWAYDYEDYLAVCTGYPWKEAYYDLLVVEATENAEGIINIEILNVDELFNVATLTQRVIIDTMPPSLTSVQGIIGHEEPGKDSVQFSFRQEDEQQDVVPLGATVTVNNDPQNNNARFLPVYYSQEFIKRLSDGSPVWTIDPLSKSVALNPLGSIKLEILAKDCYGNTGVSEMIGRIIN